METPSPRILTLAAGAPHPKAVVQSVDAVRGVLVYGWADAAGIVLDSGNSVARFAPVEIPAIAPGEASTFEEPNDATLAAAVSSSAAGPTLADLKATLKQKATLRRWETETGGIVVAGAAVATDDRTKTLLTGADRRARRDSSYTTKWKTTEGTWVPLDAATIISLADAVFDHVDRCFALERELHIAIDAAVDVDALQALNTSVEEFLVLPY